jgi:glyoxylase-like metal-dependent hydrolase (beta-lactamase superfamily II)
MCAQIIPFFEKVTETFSYLVIDPPTQAAAIIDPVLDYDPAAGRIRRNGRRYFKIPIEASTL